MSEEEAPEVDAVPATTLLVWQGVAITVPVEMEDLDPDAIEAVEEGKAIAALRGMLGSDEYDKARTEFNKQHGRRPTMRDINGLFGAIAEHFGFADAGE